MRIEEQARMPVHIPQMKWEEWVRSLQITLPGYLQRVVRQLNLISDGKFDAVNLSGTTAPTTGQWSHGDVLRNSNPTEQTSVAGDNYTLFGWICVAGGTPGTWEELRINTGTVTTGWDDLRFPAQSINVTGSTAPPATDTTETSFPGTLLFSGSADQMICGIAQMPHRWKRGSSIKPHIHWSKTTGSSSAVTWELYLRDLKNPGETAAAWSTAYTGSIVAGDQTVTDNHILSSFGTIAMTDREESVCFAWRLYRRGSTDAESNTARLYEFDIHYESDKPFGTTSEIPT